MPPRWVWVYSVCLCHWAGPDAQDGVVAPSCPPAPHHCWAAHWGPEAVGGVSGLWAWEVGAEDCPSCLQDVNGPPRELRPRLCHLRKGPQGYGFNLHSDKSRPGQYIRSVDVGSPAAHSGLRAQDRLIEVPSPGRWGGRCPRPLGACLCLCPPSACLCPRPLFVCEPQVLPGRRGVSGNLSWHSSGCRGW